MNRTRFSTLHHVAFATVDMNRTVAYWRDFLGLPLVLALRSDEGRQYAFAVSDWMLVYFFEWKQVRPIPRKKHGQPVDGPFAFDHLALQLEDFQALTILQDRLVEGDFPVSDVIDHGYIFSIYTHDPNNIPLEFNCAKAGYRITERPVLVDPEPAADLVDPWPRSFSATGWTSQDTGSRPILRAFDSDYFETGD